MNEINIKQDQNKIILSGESFELLKKLDKMVSSINERIEQNNQYGWEGGKMSEKQKKAFEELKDDFLLLKKINEVFNKLVTEHSIVLYYMQTMANTFTAQFPVELKSSIMPSQIESLEPIRQIFLSIKEIYNQYGK